MSTTTTATTHLANTPRLSTVPPFPIVPQREKPLIIQSVTATPPPPAWSQHPVSVTLDSLSLSCVSLALLVLIHFGNPTLVKVGIAAVPAVLYVYNDYRNFVALGPGGTPSTPRGYLLLKWLGLFVLRNPFVPPEAPAGLVPAAGLFARRRTKLPFRVGPRPAVAGLAPQRQTDQIGSESHYYTVGRALAQLRDRAPDKFGLAKSTLEKYGLALYAHNPINTMSRGEICHVHSSDHSFHMSLHPDDIKEILDAQWGERHPLGVKTRFASMPVSPYFCMVYAPQNDDQFEIVLRVIEAAIWFISGEDVTLDPVAKIQA